MSALSSNVERLASQGATVKRTVCVFDLDELVNTLRDGVAALELAVYGLREDRERQGMTAIADLMSDRVEAIAELMEPSDASTGEAKL